MQPQHSGIPKSPWGSILKWWNLDDLGVPPFRNPLQYGVMVIKRFLRVVTKMAGTC